MSPIFTLLSLAALGSTLYFFASESSAEPLPAIDYVPVTDAWTGETWYEPQVREPDAAPFNPAIDVSFPDVGARMTDARYNELLASYGLGPDGRPLVTGAETVIDSSAPNSAGNSASQAELNIAAFLAVIKQIESQGDYNALVGGGQFTDFSDHPARLGWPGVRRADGRKTTAAGAYQIILTTWDGGHTGRSGIKQQLNLPDFSPTSQDAAAVALIRQRGAYPDVIAGNFDRAMLKLVKEWEAFEKIAAGNYPYTLPQIREFYSASGGGFA